MKLRSVYLENFRSYKKLNIEIKNIKYIILNEKNGIGKTNILEAISFLSPGKGFRNSRLDDVINTDSNLNKSSVFFVIEIALTASAVFVATRYDTIICNRRLIGTMFIPICSVKYATNFGIYPGGPQHGVTCAEGISAP